MLAAPEQFAVDDKARHAEYAGGLDIAADARDLGAPCRSAALAIGQMDPSRRRDGRKLRRAAEFLDERLCLARIPVNLNCHCEEPAGRRGNLGPASLRRHEIASPRSQ